MIAFIKRLWRDRRGNALVIAGAAFPFLVGAGGLATDTIQWAMWKRELQRAADSAALAGVYAKAQDNAGMTAAQAVDNDLTKNNTTGITLLSGYPSVTYPSVAAPMSDAVRVELRIQKTLGFSSLFMSSTPTITASATAALIDHGRYCVVGLAPQGSALIIGGSADVDAGCGAISNSQDPTVSVGINGNAHSFIADPVAGVGGITGTINGSPNVLTYQIPMEDPFDHLSTDVPSGMPCSNFQQHFDNQTNTLTPGCYTTFNPPSGAGSTITLEAGTYYLQNTSLSLAGQTRLVGEGVTIILTGSTPGSVSMAGSSSMDLTAPTSGDYANMVLIQSPNAAVGNNNTINGDNNTLLDGAIYFPRGDVTFTGSTGQAFQCAMVVGYTVEFSGSATVQNDTSSCDADMTVTHKQVRLIA